MATTSFYWDGRSGALESDGKSAVMDAKPVISGVDYDTLVMSDDQGVHQKTVANAVIQLTELEQDAIRSYAASAVVDIPADDKVLRLDRYQSVSEHDQAVGRKNLGLDVILPDLAKAEAGNPVGTIIAYAGKTIPDGYLLCNGGPISRTTYARLFAAIGTTYGAGDGTTTFNLPNLHRRFAEFTTTTSEVGQKVEAGLPDITGKAQFMRHSNGTSAFHDVSGCISWGPQGAEMPDGAIVSSRTKTDGFKIVASSGDSTFGRSVTVQPPAVKFLPLIKA